MSNEKELIEDLLKDLKSIADKLTCYVYSVYLQCPKIRKSLKSETENLSNKHVKQINRICHTCEKWLENTCEYIFKQYELKNQIRKKIERIFSDL